MNAPRPRVYVAALDAPNALAVGASGGGIVVLDHRLPGLLRPEELDAILAFLALLPVGLAAAALSRAATVLASDRPEPLAVHLARTHDRVGQIVVIALPAFTLALRAHSRRRELAADDRAVVVTGDPLALARALRRIQRASDPYSGLWSSLFVHGEEDGQLTRLLATHPPMDDRIERLREMADDAQRVPISAF